MSVPRNSWRLFAAGLLVWLAFALAYNASRVGSPPGFTSNYGYTPDPVGVATFLEGLGADRYFADAGAEAMRKAQHVDTFLYRQMNKAHAARYGRPFVVGKQGIGDCVSWGAMHAVYCAESVDWDLGNIPDPPLLPCSESIYGGARVEARGKPGDGANPVGGYSDGATGWGAAKWLKDYGVVYREVISGHDLRTYNPQRAKAWGAFGNGGQGDAGRLDAIAKKHPCKAVTAVRTWDELVAAVTTGRPVTIASSVGFNSGPRDADGFCAASGQWMHQMCILGLRFKEHGSPRDGALIMNSWGNYVGGPKWPADMPDGCFWASRPDVERILAQGDSYAIGGVDGFAFRDIHNGAWFAPGPIETLSQADPK